MMHRRDVLHGALFGVAANGWTTNSLAEQSDAEEPRRPWSVTDTNISLFQWPARRLPLDRLDDMLGKLRSLGITRAWAGSFEGLLHRDVAGVNARLAAVCAGPGRGALVPFGTVNPALPDWEEDLRRCHEEHRMPGIRLHPNYHGYTLEDPRFARLLALAAERRVLVQLAAAMEDRRTQHPLLHVPDVELAPLVELLERVPRAKVLILNYRPAGDVFARLAQQARVYFDIARVESTDGVARLMRSVEPSRVVFGTHAPFLIPEAALIRACESQLTAEEHRRLFEQNSMRLIDSI